MTIEKMGIDRAGSLVDLLYGNAAPTQYIRELIQNGLDAEANYIDLGIDIVAVESGGPKRLRYRDNGHGMDLHELRAYFNHLSASSGPLDPHGNYGIGAKISLLPWNHGGVEVMSWKNGPESGAAIKMVWEKGEYGLQVFELEDEDGDASYETVYAADDSYCPHWVSDPTSPYYTGSGTIVICHGPTGGEDTFFGPPGHQFPDTFLATHLNTRYFNFGARSIVIRCWEETGLTGDWRTAHGSAHFLQQNAEEAGAVSLPDGTIVRWVILKRNRDFTRMRHSQTGFVGALYQDERTRAVEIYNHSKAGGDTFHRMRLFGITEAKVQKRLVLLAEPPRANGIIGVRPNAARSSLDYTGSDDRSLPWAKWGPDFEDRLPEPIKALLEEARNEAGPRRNVKDRIKHLLERMRHPAYRVEASGREIIDPNIPGRPDRAGLGTARKKAVRVISPKAPKQPVANVTNPTGETAVEFNPKVDPPEIEWRSENDEGYEEVLRDRAVSYDHNAPRIAIMNRDFFVFREEAKYWREQFPRADDSTIRVVIEEEYETLISLVIPHAWSRRGDFKWTPRDWEQLVSSVALTSVCLGFHLETKIRKSLSAKVGKSAA